MISPIFNIEIYGGLSYNKTVLVRFCEYKKRMNG